MSSLTRLRHTLQASQVQDQRLPTSQTLTKRRSDAAPQRQPRKGYSPGGLRRTRAGRSRTGRLPHYPANMRCWLNAGLLLAHRLRRWTNSKPTLGQRLIFAGYTRPGSAHTKGRQAAARASCRAHSPPGLEPDPRRTTLSPSPALPGPALPNIRHLGLGSRRPGG